MELEKAKKVEKRMLSEAETLKKKRPAGLVRAGLVAKVQEKEREVKEKAKELAPCKRPASSERGCANDEEDEGGAAKSSHLDEDHIMDEKDVSDILNFSYPYQESFYCNL